MMLLWSNASHIALDIFGSRSAGGKSELIISAAVCHVYYFTASIHTSNMGYSSKMLFKCTLDNIQHPKALEIYVSISVYN